MTEAWHWAIHGLMATVIGFFVRHHWIVYVKMDGRIEALETDKAVRDSKQMT